MLQIPNRSQGFSLIELLIAVTIIGILAAIAIPMYSDYVTRSRRADGQATLMQVAQELERCYTQFSRYNDNDCSVVSSDKVSETSDQGYYKVRTTTAVGGVLTESTFKLVAIPKKEQADDADCGNLILTHLGEKKTSTGASDDCW